MSPDLLVPSPVDWEGEASGWSPAKLLQTVSMKSERLRSDLIIQKAHVPPPRPLLHLAVLPAH